MLILAACSRVKQPKFVSIATATDMCISVRRAYSGILVSVFLGMCLRSASFESNA